MTTTVAKDLEFVTLTKITTLVKSIQLQPPPSKEVTGAELRRIAKHAERSVCEIARLTHEQLCRQVTGSSLREVQSHACYIELLRLRDKL